MAPPIHRHNRSDDLRTPTQTKCGGDAQNSFDPRKTRLVNTNSNATEGYAPLEYRPTTPNRPPEINHSRVAGNSKILRRNIFLGRRRISETPLPEYFFGRKNDILNIFHQYFLKWDKRDIRDNVPRCPAVSPGRTGHTPYRVCPVCPADVPFVPCPAGIKKIPNLGGRNKYCRNIFCAIIFLLDEGLPHFSSQWARHVRRAGLVLDLGPRPPDHRRGSHRTLILPAASAAFLVWGVVPVRWRGRWG